MHSDSSRSSAPGRTALTLALLFIFGTGVGLAAAEILARATWRAEIAPARRKPPPADHLETLEESVWVLAAPGVEGIYRGGYFHNNSAGFRGPEYAKTAAPGVLRIAVVGDSVTMGSGVSNDETYSALLGDLLARRLPGEKFEVLNFGLSGLNIEMVYQRTRKLVTSFHPDMIVYGFTLNDLEGEGYRTNRRDSGGVEERKRYHRFADSRSYLLRLMWPRLQSLRDLISPPPQSYLAELQFNYFNNPPVWDRFKADLTKLANLAKQEDTPLVVFIHTTLAYLNWFHPYQPYYARMESVAAALGLPVIESLSVHRGYAAESLWVNAVDPHPNAEGHRLLARALADGIASLPAELRTPHARKP